MTRDEHIARQEADRDPTDAETPDEDLQAEDDKLKDEINALYWTYSRSTSIRNGPPNCPEKYKRRRAIAAELGCRCRERAKDAEAESCAESMDGDHESALASVYGPND